MKELDAVNQILLHSGHSTVNSLADGDDRAAKARWNLRKVRKQVLIHPYPFNSRKTTIYPTSSGRVPVPADALSLWIPKRNSYWTQYYCVRGDESDSKKYIWDRENDEWVNTKVEDVIFSYDIEAFDLLPEPLAEWIAWEATQEYYAAHREGAFSPYVQNKLNGAKALAVNTYTKGNIWKANDAYVRMAGYYEG